MTFQHWLKKSTKPIPRGSIWWLSGHGSRSRQNQSQEARFDDFPAMAPEVDKTSPRKLDLMIFDPWIQESTKQWLSWTLNDPEYSFWDTRRIALGNEKYRFCLIKLWFSYIYARSHQDLPWAPRELPGANRTLPEHQWAAITGALASQMNNSWKYMILQTFLTVVKCYSVGTRAPLTKIDIKQRLHN